ncbi:MULTISPECIES: tyrosine-type recombinase/integrase [Paraburkholderia]|uniref:tyrosine-type recombinase/integrase n=1 Tax=Paraburkholderia TaxID=1822464 RepID=UPI000368E3BA|nr:MULTISPECIES: site-specific integrase [Paraburkholderia]MDH6149558.1 integrase [Paraburkholderia sp. WSM4179]
MASIFQEGAGWAVRNRSRNDAFYQAGFASRDKAKAWLNRHEKAIRERGRPFGLGPHRTTLAQALADYVPQRVPFRKSGDQLCRRLNRYLRYGRLPTYTVTPVSHRTEPSGSGPDKKTTVYFTLERVPAAHERVIPRGLGPFRHEQARRHEKSEKLRERLARMKVADITRHDILQFVHALREEGLATQTVVHEQAILREFFNHARSVWNWTDPEDNPATDLNMPDIDNARNRILTSEEEARLQAALADSSNVHVAPFIALLLETAMRQSELLVTTQWRDIDWARRVLRLWDAKSGGREVPLTQHAIAILQALPRGNDEDRVFPVTIAAINSAWNKAVGRAGIQDIRKHDLRHCALTRTARLLKGDIFLLKVVSGHKTLAQLARYVNANADDAVEALDAAQAGHPAPLHARGAVKHPMVEDAVRALDAAHVPDGSRVDAQEAVASAPDMDAVQAVPMTANGAIKTTMPVRPGEPAAAPDEVAGPSLEDNGRVLGQGCAVAPDVSLGVSGAANIISFAAWRARHAA